MRPASAAANSHDVLGVRLQSMETHGPCALLSGGGAC